MCPSADGQSSKLPTPSDPPMDYRLLVDTLPEGVFTVDKQWRITSFNKAAESITGYLRPDVLGRPCWEVFRADLCRCDCPMAVAMKTGEAGVDQEIRTVNRRGERQTLVVNVSIIQNETGNVVGAVETFRTSLWDARKNALLGTSAMGSQGIVGNSDTMQAIYSILPDVADSSASVLIYGESGTGKDLIARAIHAMSPRCKAPYVAVNCASLAESLLESELFGHEKGAFTGAERTKPGRFELARGGTLFLDEIGELKPELQVKLLRVIEQREFERVGGIRTIPMDARIISATHRNLAEAMVKGDFRKDLYYRLRTVPIDIAPLCERTDDIPLLVDHFIRKFNRRYDKSVRSMDPKVLDKLKTCPWPGNVRELERCIEHAFVFVKGPVIFARHLPNLNELEHSCRPARKAVCREMNPTPAIIDRKAVMAALDRCGGRRTAAADLLGISRTSMWRRMKQFGLL